MMDYGLLCFFNTNQIATRRIRAIWGWMVQRCWPKAMAIRISSVCAMTPKAKHVFEVVECAAMAPKVRVMFYALVSTFCFVFGHLFDHITVNHARSEIREK